MKRFEGVLVRAEREKKWDLNLASCSSLSVERVD